MSEQTPRTHQALIVSSFNDIGTGERYEAGTTKMIDAGVFANYEAAGLVRRPSAVETKAKPAH